jgi:hypothetical protein
MSEIPPSIQLKMERLVRLSNGRVMLVETDWRKWSVSIDSGTKLRHERCPAVSKIDVFRDFRFPGGPSIDKK